MRTALFCPFTAGTLLWQAETGAWTLSVCVRGTFSLLHGREAVLADAQEPVTGDLRGANDPRSSLRAASDFVPFKPKVDVVLVGSAYAPSRDAVEALVARLAIGSLDKAVGVIGDRTWIDGPDGLEPSAPAPFRSLPIEYERAAQSRDNPHGFDLTARAAKAKLALPNLEPVNDGADAAAPGFGPLAPESHVRRRLLRAEDSTWVNAIASAGPAPARLNFGYFNAAPADQQVDVLKPGDSLVLENLNREHPRIETRLPSVRPRAFIVPGDIERGFEVPLRIDTAWIDSDRALVTLSWRGVATVDNADEDAIGSLVVAAETKGREVGYAEIAKLLRDGGGMTTTDSDTFGEARTVVKKSAVGVDSDLIPTPGPFRPTRPLPPIVQELPPEPVTAPMRVEIARPEMLDPDTTDEPKTLTRTDPVKVGRR